MGDWIIALCTVLGALLYLYADAQLGAGTTDAVGPTVFPAVIGVGLLLSGLLLMVEIRRRRPAAAPAAAAPGGHHRLLLLAMAAWTLIYYFAFEPVGYPIATVVYLFPMLAYFNRGRWITNALVAIGFTLVAYVLFAKMLKVAIPAGLLPL